MSQFSSVIFDLDGTLVDPRASFIHCIGFSLNSLGRILPPATELYSYIGTPIHRTFGNLLETEDKALIQDAVDRYRQRLRTEGIRENAVYMGVTEMLIGLEGRGVTLFVATSRLLEFAVPILEHCRLGTFFLGVYGTEAGSSNTPKRELISAILDDHRIAPSSAVMVGDRSYDIIGAKENQVFSIGVTYGYGSAIELWEAGADMLCHSPAEVLQRLVL